MSEKKEMEEQEILAMVEPQHTFTKLQQGVDCVTRFLVLSVRFEPQILEPLQAWYE